ncbi:MAG: sigma-54 dependent transcriptional regulator [Betaproteobacteria bacterium]
MSNEFQDGKVAFVQFPISVATGRSGSATIATFPRPLVSGRPRVAGCDVPKESQRLIGESPEMVDVELQLRRVARSQAAVMLVGESGTGKEVAAQFLHAHSLRAKGPLVAVNCGAIPANLVEAELFGYERGAFTGAIRRHQGYFERADGGTLLLDEITEMPIDLQAKLLRILETGRMVRVGGSEEIAVDVRVITASNLPPESIVRGRRLREDLYYRLAVFVVRLPSLRQRNGDIELLARAFLDRLNSTYGTAKRFDPATLALARSHSWPGNVRELKNCVERSYVLCDDLVRLDVRPVQTGPGVGAAPADGVHVPIGMTLAEAEREVLLATLRHCNGNKRRAARILGVSVKTIYNKLGDDRSETPSPPDEGNCRPVPERSTIALGIQRSLSVEESIHDYVR